MDSKVQKDSGFTLVPSAMLGAMNEAPQENDDWVFATLGRALALFTGAYSLQFPLYG